jgi:hypothetical protein
LFYRSSFYKWEFLLVGEVYPSPAADDRQRLLFKPGGENWVKGYFFSTAHQAEDITEFILVIEE